MCAKETFGEYLVLEGNPNGAPSRCKAHSTYSSATLFLFEEIIAVRDQANDLGLMSNKEIQYQNQK